MELRCHYVRVGQGFGGGGVLDLHEIFFLSRNPRGLYSTADRVYNDKSECSAVEDSTVYDLQRITTHVSCCADIFLL